MNAAGFSDSFSVTITSQIESVVAGRRHARNKDQKLVGHFNDGIFYRLLYCSPIDDQKRF